MKKASLFIVITAYVIFLLTSITLAQSNPIRIMPLGDSITRGVTGGLTADYEVGYRQKLYLDLINAGYTVDFVGSLNNGSLAVPGFDYNHEGHGGWRDDEVAGQIFDWLAANPADVVLLHIGTNGPPDPTPDDVELILNEIDHYNKDIVVVLALIINNKTYNPGITEFNNNIRAMAEARIANCDKIIVVDMENALTYPDDMDDNLHPNATGYSKMANVWFSAVEQILSGSYQPPPCTPPGPGPDLQIHYTFNEGTGTAVIDSSTYNRNGTITGAVWTNGQSGSGLGFDGVNDYVSIPRVNNDEISIAAWFYKNANDTSYADSIFSGYRWNSVTQQQQGFELRFFKSAPNTLDFILVTRNANGIKTKKVAQKNLVNSVGSWHHAVGTYNKTTGEQKLYVDGLLANTQVHPAGNTIVPLAYYPDMRIGYSRVNNGYFNGIIDDVRLYSRALSSQEVQNMYNPTDTTPPVISNIQVVAGDTGATVTWDTDEASTSRVDYGTTTAYGGIAENATLVTAHTVMLTGLTPDTLYHYKVTSADGSANSASSPDSTFSTTNVTAPSLVTNFSASDTVTTQVGLGWTNPADVDLAEVVVQRKEGAYPVSHTDGVNVYTNLSPAVGGQVSFADTAVTTGVTYYYAVFSRDTALNWNDTVTAGQNADTGIAPAATDTTPPVISNIQVVAGDTGATVTWDTDEPSTSLVDYGTTTAYGGIAENATLVTAHTVVLTGLTPGTLYHYQVTSVDGSANSASSVDMSFSTSSGSGLQAQYTFDEGSGTVANDVSGNGNNGTISGAQWTVGKIGGGLSFDGVNDYVSVPRMNYEEISVSAWFYKNTNDTSYADAIFGAWRWNSSSQLEEGFDLRFPKNAPDTLQFILVTKNVGGTRAKGTATYTFSNSVGNWHHVASTYNKTTGEQKLYVDGLLANTQLHPAGNTIVPLAYYPDMRIGYSRVNNGYFNGIIDEVRLYNRALSDQDVQSLYINN